MKINRNIQNKITLPGKIKNKKESNPLPEDTVEIGKKEDSHFTTCRKVFGTTGTAAGVAAGRVATPVLASIGAGKLAGSLTGSPWGTVVGAVVGLAAGAFLEYKSRIGRFAGGITGGAIGSATGAVASAIPGYKPSETLKEETKGFTFKSLFKKLWNPQHTSHKLITSEEAQKVIKDLKPGDLIITNHDGDYKFELVQKFTGHTGNWTHVGIVGDEEHDNKNVLEVLVSADGPVITPAEEVFTRNHHVMILRPDYKSPESLKTTLKEARDYLDREWFALTKDNLKELKNEVDTGALKSLENKKFEKKEDLAKELKKAGYNEEDCQKILNKSKQKVTYDFSFKLGTDDELYCQEHAYKAMQKGSPEINITPTSFLGMKLLTADNFIDSPDIKEVYSTGSNFWINFLSKFD